MKELFPEFYQGKEISKNDIITSQNNKDILYCFDANALLDYLRISKRARVDYLNFIKNYKDFIFIPHQSLTECFNGLKSSVGPLKQKDDILKDMISKQFDEAFDKFDSEINKIFDKMVELRCLHSINIKKKTLNNIHSEIETSKDTILKTHLKEYQNLYDDLLDELNYNTPEKSLINEIFNELPLESFGEKIDSKLLAVLIENFEKTAFSLDKDGNKKGCTIYYSADNELCKTHKKYGDYLIWWQIINQIKKLKENSTLKSITRVLFISNDNKEELNEDSFNSNSLPLDLVNEFYHETGLYIQKVSLASLLEYTKGSPVMNEENFEKLVKVLSYSPQIYETMDKLYDYYSNLSDPAKKAIEGIEKTRAKMSLDTSILNK